MPYKGEKPWALLCCCILMSFRFGLLCKKRHGTWWHSLQLTGISDQLLEALGGVQYVVAELGGKLAQLLLNCIEPLLLFSLYMYYT